MMSVRTWCLGGLLFVVAGCQPPQSLPEPERSPAQAEAERLATDRGFDLGEVNLVPTRDEGGQRHALRFGDVPVWGLGTKTVDGVTRMAGVRFEPTGPVETRPELSAAQAERVALAALGDPVAQVVESELVLQPREERRLRPDAPVRAQRRRNADQFERVVTGLDLVYRLVLTAPDAGLGERGWSIGVDARAGVVLWKAPLEVELNNPTYRKVTGYGKYAGTFTFSVPYDLVNAEYPMEDLHHYVYQAIGSGGSVIDYVSPDAKFGDGQLYNSANAVLSANGETAAVDAQYAVSLAWTVYDQILGQGGPGTTTGMDVRVHAPIANAAYGPSLSRPSLSIGYRDYPSSGQMAPLATTDVVAHEIGHDFFMRAVAGNPIRFPTGASELRGMNEGTGDVMGFATELVRDTLKAGRSIDLLDQTPLRPANLTIGEETGRAIRNLLTPSIDEWYEGIGAEEEHDAGGPLARMYLLLAYGCQRTDTPDPANPWQCPLVPQGFVGVGPYRATRIFGDAVKLLPAGSGYLEMREVALAAAANLDGATGGPLKRATGSAFAAINVGPAADSNPPTATLSCRQDGTDIECTGAIYDAETPGQWDQLAQLQLDGGPPFQILNWNFREYFLGASLAPGTHTVQLTAWDLWHNQVTRTTTVYLDNTPPSATLTVTGPPKKPLFHVDASDLSGISAVEFYDGSQYRVGILAPPFETEFDTSTWTDGTHPMVVKVSDPFGNKTVLNHALKVDNTAPAVTMTVGTGTPPFNVNVTVSDASPVSRVDFKVDGVVFATRTNAATSYQAAYTPTDPLAHNLVIEVTDTFGNKGTAVTAAPRDLTPPTVTFSAAQWFNTVTLTTNVSDTCTVQMPYALFVDGALVAQPTSPGYVLTFGTSMAAGVHVFQAVVADGCGNSTTFQTTFVKSFTPPVITNILRDDSQPKKPKFTVQCTDADGVHHVEMRENGVVMASDSTAPYEFVVDTTSRADGSFTVLFQCMDIYGVPSTAETRTVTADNTGPSFALTVYGAGRSYLVSGGSVGDPRGVQSVTLGGGVIPGFSVTLTQAPWAFQWNIPGTFTIQTEMPFSISAKDTWGNTRSLAVLCAVDTNSTIPTLLNCH